LIVESSFLSKLAQNQDNDDPVGLKRSQKYRQFVAIGKFISVLKSTAAKYGIVVDALEAVNTTRIGKVHQGPLRLFSALSSFTTAQVPSRFPASIGTPKDKIVLLVGHDIVGHKRFRHSAVIQTECL
jgi:hypothetical protein